MAAAGGGIGGGRAATSSSHHGPPSPPSSPPPPPIPKMGPQPTLLSRKEIDRLHETLSAVVAALETLGVDYVVTGGSLLGAIRQHSVLFCDDDVDVAILERYGDTRCYDLVSNRLAELLGSDYSYSIKPWEGGDKVRPKRCTSVFLDLFVIRRYDSMDDLRNVIGVKKNGRKQSDEYVEGIVSAMRESAFSQGETEPLFPLWHFNTRKAIEMWPKEVYRTHELFPLCADLKFGPHTGIKGPRMPVLLLKRAFGSDCFDVYYQSDSHKIPKNKEKAHKEKESGTADNGDLKPLIQGGGTWEGGRKVELTEEQYLPMQPVSRAKRRPTLHGKEQLFLYLTEQSRREEEWMKRSANDPTREGNGESNGAKKANGNDRLCPPRRTVYMDGVFDLFHVGHLRAIQQCADLGDKVIIGVTGDDDASKYKRPPVVSQSHRASIVGAIKGVSEVVCPCPLVVTHEFMERMGIDLVVHGFADEEDFERQREFFADPMDAGKFKRIEYTGGVSTTDVIAKIREGPPSPSPLPSPSSSPEDESTPSEAAAMSAPPPPQRNPRWFGSAVASATNDAPSLPFDPFPLSLRQIIEPHVNEARTRRSRALDAIRIVTGESIYDETMDKFRRTLGREGEIAYDVQRHPVRAAFLRCSGLDSDFDPSKLHVVASAKTSLLRTLVKRGRRDFQETYDDFVRSVCVPRLSDLFCDDDDDDDGRGFFDDVYYQCFPCVRIVRPGEFSVGPHADVTYGHHPCSVNFYLTLTEEEDRDGGGSGAEGSTSSLFAERVPGAEDWHPISASSSSSRGRRERNDDGGATEAVVRHFAGAICLHWTTENKTDQTRVSLDFRLIPGPMYRSLECGGDQPGGKVDMYRRNEGYYSRCARVQRRKDKGDEEDETVWERDAPLLDPDRRVGFPWTVKDWDEFEAEEGAK